MLSQRSVNFSSEDGVGIPIYGGTFITTKNMNGIPRQSDSGINILRQAAALEALWDSADSFPHPECHPKTRAEILGMLWPWLTKNNRHKHILWLCGPAGAGKSAIMQTLCQRLQDANYPTPSFFFRRGHATRSNGQVLFTTLAYQITLQYPHLKIPISQIVERDPCVVGKTAGVQFQKLVVEPCQSLKETDLAPILLIDGLDECDNWLVQQDILRSIGDAFSKCHLPIKILIASRPELHIREMFVASNLTRLHHTLNIHPSFENVETYLRHQFLRIYQEHIETMHAVPTPWPSSDTIATLVVKSSGYFIYASTTSIIKFIDDKDFRPNERLLIVVENTTETDNGSPFEALDQLYTQILSAAPARQRLCGILTAIMTFGDLTVAHIEQLLGLQPGDVGLALRGLHSILQVPTVSVNRITVHHASFRDFLEDPARSGVFCIRGAQKWHIELARSVLKAIRVDSAQDASHVA
ncbi:hypothetical protein K438DRAFT_404262 [Mycena galopus ATCC 62051]|nr:hypothetical protein K438DRAFT_404262 [Mycena galopus ATCC 62051]